MSAATASTAPGVLVAGRAEGGGVSVSWPCTPIALQVCGPTTPSTVRLLRACSVRTAASVSGPKSPSAGRCSAICSCLTASIACVSELSSLAPPVAAVDAGALLEVAGSCATPSAAYVAEPCVDAGAELAPGSDPAPAIVLLTSAMKALPALSLRSAALVRGPTTPSTLRPLLAWKLRTAASVSGPNIPSTLMPPSACWSSCTCLPSLP